MAAADDPTDSYESASDLFGVFDGEFFQEIARRKAEGRDAKILLTAKDGQTGVGKSNCSDFLGYVLDTSPKGFSEEKVTIDPFEFLDMYGWLPKGSATVMEEGEQFDARRSNSNKNVDAAEKWQMARVREVVAIINLPSPQEIDSRFERLCDYWINVETRGLAKVYKKRIHPIKRKLYYETLQTIKWPNMDQSESFKHMDRLKHDRLDNDEHDANWVRQSEVNKQLEKAKDNTEEEVRNKWLASLYHDTELTGQEIADLPVCEISRGRVAQIANEVR
jgi:hypothetical protein